jgi:antitoxin (DNA-binding transcriptional repressor) of toxin-antitoxin stability system
VLRGTYVRADFSAGASQRQWTDYAGTHEGQSYIVSRNGTPVGELRPLRRHRFVSAHAVAEMFRDAPRVDAATLRRDLDDVVDQDLTDRV